MAELVREDFNGAAGPLVATTNSTFDLLGGTASTLSITATALLNGLGQSMRFVYAAALGYGQKAVTSATTGYVRYFVQFDGPPSTNVVFGTFRDIAGSANRASVRVNTAGTLSLLNTASAVATTTTVLANGVTYRIEHDVVGAVQTMRLYSGNGTTPLETITGAAPNVAWNGFRLGSSTSGNLSGYADSLVYRDDATPGPAVLVTTSPGPFGESLQHALNRVAGTTALDAQGAAQAWASAPGVDLLGALNKKNGTSGLGLNAVLNALAGTTNLDAQGAAQQLKS